MKIHELFSLSIDKEGKIKSKVNEQAINEFFKEKDENIKASTKNEKDMAEKIERLGDIIKEIEDLSIAMISNDLFTELGLSPYIGEILGYYYNLNHRYESLHHLFYKYLNKKKEKEIDKKESE